MKNNYFVTVLKQLSLQSLQGKTIMYLKKYLKEGNNGLIMSDFVAYPTNEYKLYLERKIQDYMIRRVYEIFKL